MKLELDMRNLLEEKATQTEWKDGEVKDLKEHMKNLEDQLQECQSLCLEKEKVRPEAPGQKARRDTREERGQDQGISLNAHHSHRCIHAAISLFRDEKMAKDTINSSKLLLIIPAASLPNNHIFVFVFLSINYLNIYSVSVVSPTIM